MAAMATTAAVLAATCGSEDRREAAPHASLSARPSPTRTTWAAGTHALGLDASRDAILHLPPRDDSAPLPLIVLLHGAGGSGEWFLSDLTALADELGVALLAPDSRAPTWDAIHGETRTLFDVLFSEARFTGFGPDVAFLDRTLDRVFRTVDVDPSRVAIGGFSDGATYALSLGLINGDLFRRIVAFSPGFVVEGAAKGQPAVFISHGRADRILPIDRCSRRIVPALRQRGYEVTFREFDGGHGLPNAIAREGLVWAAATSPQ